MYQSTRLLLTTAAACLGLPALAQAPAMQHADLPDGEGKPLVQGMCVACHQTDLIVESTGYSQDGWRYLASKMIDLPEPVQSTVTGYLAENFPEKTDNRPVLIPGDTEISFQEWVVPTLGQRPRDPFQDADGNIWWAGMYGSIVGMLDPRTGEMKEYKLAADARPHSITSDANGDVWYTGNGNGTVGKIDRATGEITVYPMPDPAARDPHTPVFARDGSLWFTLQNSNMLGRLDPATGEVELRTMPTERARPYGIREDSQGMLWIAYRGAYKLAKVDPQTRELTEYPTPSDGQYPGMGHYIRRLAIDSNDMIWYVDSGRGELGRFNPQTGEFKQWPSPSGPDSHPYAIEVVNDTIWFNESDKRPDALVRFDPKTETFQSWAIPSGIGVIRNMAATPEGNLVIHQSSTNTVGLVTIGDSDS